MKKIGIIPARLGSSRFPNKPLAKIKNFTMIEHVYKRSLLCKDLDDLFVATCDKEIKNVVESFGGQVIMTSSEHERCTDRIAEAIKNIDCNIVVNIQGDEPLVHPEMITNSINAIQNTNKIYQTANNASKIFDEKEFFDPNNVKVLFNLENEALYFSREPIPSIKKQDIFDDFYGYKQVCIISFNKDYLFHFNKLEQTPLEKKESIDMLRCIENGHKVKIVETTFPNWSVDNLEDLKIVQNMFQKDKLFDLYK